MKHVAIKLTKCTLVVTEQELFKALGAFPDIFQAAVKRGKQMLRAEQAAKRTPKAGTDSTIKPL